MSNGADLWICCRGHLGAPPCKIWQHLDGWITGNAKANRQNCCWTRGQGGVAAAWRRGEGLRGWGGRGRGASIYRRGGAGGGRVWKGN